MRLGHAMRARLLTPASGSALLLGAVVLYVALVLTGIGGAEFHDFRDTVFYNGILVAAAAFCLARPFVRSDDRLAWTFVGLGLLVWGVGDIYYSVALADLEEIPFPSVADAFYLAFYPLVYAGLALLLRNRLQGLRGDLWVDGVIAALTLAALVAALVFGVIVDVTGGDPLTVGTNLAYPFADLGLIAVVTVVLAMTGWHVDRAWGCVLAGSVVFSVSDTFYLYQTAVDSYDEGTIVDAGWISGIVLIAMAAWQPRRAIAAVRLDGFWVFALPTAFGTLALGLLVYDHFRPVNTVALVLAACAVGAVIGRMAITFRRNAALLRASRREAETDALTGLANRRRLVQDLENRIETGVHTLLLLFDLDGFKSYNDAFGHPAGDSLLHRLAQKLGVAAEPFGTAYRMGGDEFCVIADAHDVDRATVIAAALRALRDESEGFRITSAYGAAVLPDEATDLSEAMRIADTRLYGNKDSRRASAGRQTREVLISILHERDESSSGHLSAVAQLAQAVGQRLGLADADLQDLTLAAELHDVGKLAIPDSILSKPGALTEEEWVFVHRHTQIGERILASAPALARIGRLVRSTHERVDGLGYPDGLVGDEIRLLTRIVSACDAFFAMTEERPYRAAMTEDQALAELRRCIDTQFDGTVVETLVDARRELSLQLVA